MLETEPLISWRLPRLLVLAKPNPTGCLGYCIALPIMALHYLSIYTSESEETGAAGKCGASFIDCLTRNTRTRWAARYVIGTCGDVGEDL